MPRLGWSVYWLISCSTLSLAIFGEFAVFAGISHALGLQAGIIGTDVRIQAGARKRSRHRRGWVWQNRPQSHTGILSEGSVGCGKASTRAVSLRLPSLSIGIWRGRRGDFRF